MSRKTIVAFVLGALLAASAPALADHIQEPTTPIKELQLFVGHYSTRTSVGCQDGQIGTWPDEFVRLRANVYLDQGRGSGGDPTEHFDVVQTFNYPWTGAHHEHLYIKDIWRHQNTPPHSADRWQIDSTQIGNVMKSPGLWRIHYKVKGRESGVVLTQECIFVVPEERLVAQFARPSSDGTTDGAWVNESEASTNLFQSIDEASASDADWLRSPGNPTDANSYQTGLSSITDPASSSSHVVRYRIGKMDGSGNFVTTGQEIRSEIRLRQGDNGTIIATWDHLDLGLAATFSQTLSGSEADAITDYSTLHLEFDPRNFGAGAGRALGVTWAELEVPDAAGGGTVSLSGSGANAVDGTAVLSVELLLSGSGATAANGSGVLEVTRSLSASSANAADGSGALDVTLDLSGAGANAATGSGDLTVTGATIVSLSGSGASASQGTGSLDLTRDLAGAGAAAAAGFGTLAVLRALNGSGANASAGSGTLRTTGTTFWTTDSVAYTAAGVAYTPLDPDEPPPW